VDRGIAVVASTSFPTMPISYARVIQSDSDAEFSLSFHRVVELDYNLRVDILRQVCDVLSFANLE